MDLHKYYKENKDDINSSIMEIASDLAVARLVDKYHQPFETFVESVKPIDPKDLEDPKDRENLLKLLGPEDFEEMDDSDDTTCYKEEYQDEYNRFYDEEYDRLTRLMKFDITAPDGIARNCIESQATEAKTVYATIRYDIVNRNGDDISEEDIDNILDLLRNDTKIVDDFIVNTEICGRHDKSSI